MQLEVISFAWKAFSHDNVKSLTLTTKDWEITILDNHSPLTSVLIPWIVRMEFSSNESNMKNVLAVWWGIVEVNDSKVKILIDVLYTLDEVNDNDANDAIKQAEELMAKYKWSKDKLDMEKFIEAEDLLLKSVAKLKLSQYK